MWRRDSGQADSILAAHDLLALSPGPALLALGVGLLTLGRPSLLSGSYEISLRPNDEDSGLHDRSEGPWQEKIRHRPSARAVAYVQSHLHRLWPDSRIFHLAQGHDEPGGLPGGGGGVQRAND